MSLLRQKIAYIFFGLASLFKFLGKITRSDVTVICDPLTLPGWFVLDGCLIEIVDYKGQKLKGSEWHRITMPFSAFYLVIFVFHHFYQTSI